MATWVKINDWVGNLAKNVDVESDQFVVALSNTAPGSETTPPTGDGNGVLANITQVAYTNCSTRNITTTSTNAAGGTLTIALQDLTLTASGGSVGPFRYVYIYDDTVTVPADPLMGYYDYGSSITLADTETFLIDFAASSFTFT